MRMQFYNFQNSLYFIKKYKQKDHSKIGVTKLTLLIEYLDFFQEKNQREKVEGKRIGDWERGEGADLLK